MQEKTLRIPTRDGSADAVIIYPGEASGCPGVLLLPDAFGIRPQLVTCGRRIAAQGYCVLLPNVFYRNGVSPLIDHSRLRDPALRPQILKQVAPFIAELTPELFENDAGHYLAVLNEHSAVQSGNIGTVGYCIGGALAIRTAGYYPNAVRAAASFHAGNIATDSPNSPHLLANMIKAEVYFGLAENDPHMDATQVGILAKSLCQAAAPFQMELFHGAKHGWTLPDISWAYDMDLAERAWARLFEFFERCLKQSRS